jgi:hypothetical protein
VWASVSKDKVWVSLHLASDSLFHRCKDQSNVARVGRLGQMRVDAQLRSIGLRESPEDVFGCFVDVVSTRVFFKKVRQRYPWNLLLEQVDLVEEQNDARP